jgi:orotate phosphoribosyltransferase
MSATLSKDEVLKIFRDTKALLDGHFLLTSGLHSPNYFQCAKVLQYPRHLEALSAQIAARFNEDRIDVVISPGIGGIVVGTEVGRQLGARTIFAERKEGKMGLRRGFELARGERVLVVEDVTTTGGSVREVIELVRQAGAVLAGVGCIVDRSNGKVKFDAKQVSVLVLEVVTYEPQACPLCQQGSPAVKPGSRGNY